MRSRGIWRHAVMAKRNTRAAKAARRKARKDRELARALAESGAPEFGIEGGQPGCPEVPRTPIPVEAAMRRPGAVRVPDEDLPEGMAAAVKWPCSTCGQVHVFAWGSPDLL